MTQIILNLLIVLVCFYIMAKIVDNQFIKSLDNIADWLKLPPSVAGATLMAAGTSAPEISTNLIALFKPDSNPAGGVGTIVGSAIFQILVVIGFAAIVKTSYLNWKPVLRDGIFYAFTIALLILFIYDGTFTVIESGILLLTYIIYLVGLFIWSRKVDESNEPDPMEMLEEAADRGMTERKVLKAWNIITLPLDFFLDKIPDPEKNKKWTYPVFIASLGIIALLCYFLVGSAETLATAWGIPSVVVYLTILAGGTSVPEVISSAVVSKQGRGDMAIANAIGSNVFDILVSLGLPLFIYTLINGPITNVGAEGITSSIFLLFATLIAVIALLASQKFKATKPFGFILILTYIIYVSAVVFGWLPG